MPAPRTRDAAQPRSEPQRPRGEPGPPPGAAVGCRGGRAAELAFLIKNNNNGGSLSGQWRLQRAAPQVCRPLQQAAQ